MLLKRVGCFNRIGGVIGALEVAVGKHGAFATMLLKLGDHFPLRVTEWLVAGMLLSWGVATLNMPATEWNVAINRELADLAGRTFWGLYAVALGVMRLAALFVNGAIRRSPHARAIAAFLSCLIWSQLTLAAFTFTWAAPSMSFYPWLLVADVYNVWRAARDAKLSDMKARHRRGAVPDAATT